MADAKVLLPKGQPYQQGHLQTYLDSNGREGHIVDRTPVEGSLHTTTLLLKVFGRKTGALMVAPLIYANMGPEYLIVASKGGAPEHPAWFKNLIARPDVEFQVGETVLRGTWRIPEGAERQMMWDYAQVYFPPYKAYQAKTEREIPLVLLKASETIPALLPA